MGIGPIPFTAIVEYFTIYDLEDFEEFSYVIRHMDNIYLQLNTGVSTREKGGKKSDGTGNPDKKNSSKG